VYRNEADKILAKEVNKKDEENLYKWKKNWKPLVSN
jgi:hypothetical protein